MKQHNNGQLTFKMLKQSIVVHACLDVKSELTLAGLLLGKIQMQLGL